MKKAFILSTLAVLSASIYAMDMESIWHYSYINPKDESQKISEFEHGTDPNRYGTIFIPAEITEAHHRLSSARMSDLQTHRWNVKTISAYPENRHKIALAVMCKQYHPDFAYIATERNDLPLWKHLLQYRDQIKKILNVDHDNDIFTPPLYLTKRVEMLKFLVEEARASIPNNTDTDKKNAVHYACHYDRSPNMLAYCIQQYPQGVHSKDTQGNTPLLTLCKSGFGETYAKDHYLEDTLDKFKRLKDAGAKLSDKDNLAHSALDIIGNQTNGMHADNVKTLNLFAATIQSAITEQRNARMAAARTQQCSICLENMNENLYELDCLHIFHENCILLTAHAGITTCPLCRAETIPKDLAQANNDDNNNLSIWFEQVIADLDADRL